MFKLSERPIKSGHFDLGVRERILAYLGRQLVPVSPALSLQQEQQNRLNKTVEVPHGAGAGMLVSMTRTGAVWHFLFPS
jgi:hypothetical protein